MTKDKSVHFDREKNEFVGLTAELKKQLAETYKGIDLDKELFKMGLWLNSSKGKNRVGAIAFILHWLDNAHPDKPLNSINTFFDTVQSDTPLGHLLTDYLQGLWKNREHILEFNTIRR